MGTVPQAGILQICIKRGAFVPIPHRAPSSMPHIHPIDGFSLAATQYQDYLERTRSGHNDEHPHLVERKKRERKDDEETGAEADESEDRPEEEAKDGQAPESDVPAEETVESPDDGTFGSHYA